MVAGLIPGFSSLSDDTLTLCILMDSSFWFDTMNLGLSIGHILGCQVIILKNIVFFCLKISFTFTNSVDPDEMQHFAAVHLGLHCLQKYSFRGFPDTKG